MSALRDRFARQLPRTDTLRERGDEDLAALARTCLAESILHDGILYGMDYSHIEMSKRDLFLREALALLKCMRVRKVCVPKTFRVVLDALLFGWAKTHDAALEKRASQTLLLLPKSESKEEDQLGAALREVAAQHLFFDTARLLRLLTLASPASCETVVRWAFQTLGSKAKPEDLLFATACLQTAGNASDELRRAAVHHIDAARQTLTIVKEKVRFTQALGGPYKPMDEQCVLRSSGLVDYVWVTSQLGDSLNKSIKSADKWLDSAERQVLEQLGPPAQRGFGVDLLVHIYPHVENWFARRHTLTPLETVSRSA
ncbi:MAG TPA: hypothetical protein VIY48_14865 [Candidatus Paceibacterota bacterium]